MRALRDGARTQGDRKGSPLLETAWQADPPVYSRGWACPCPAALHSFFHSPAASFMVARRALLPPFSHAASSYEHVCITEQQRSAAVSRQELVKRNRQVADTDAGRVIDGGTSLLFCDANMLIRRCSMGKGGEQGAAGDPKRRCWRVKEGVQRGRAGESPAPTRHAWGGLPVPP